MFSKLNKTLIGMGRKGLQGLNVALDSWENDVSGFGTSDDKTTYTRFVGGPILSPQECSNLYHGDDLAARMVDVVGDEMLRESFAVDFGDPGLNQAVADKLEALQADAHFADGIRWGRGYGEGAILIGADDGRSAMKPLIPERARDVNYLYVLDGRYYWPLTFYREPGHPLLGQPELFGVMPPGNSAQPTSVVHESRLIRFGGSPTGDQERAANQSRDFSVLQRAYEPLRSFNTGWKSVEILLTDGHQSVFKMQGLAEMIGLDGEALAQARLKIVNMYRSVLRAIVVDAGDKEGGVGAEDFTRNSVSFTAIPDVLDRIMLRLAAAVQIPVTILMGQSPAGMNATGESDFRWFYDRIRSQQNIKLAPKIRRLLRILLATRNWQAKPKALTIKFPPLWSEPPLQAAQTRLALIQGDTLMVTNQIAMAEEVALTRLKPEGFAGDLVLTPEATKAREAFVKSELVTMALGGGPPDADGPPAPPKEASGGGPRPPFKPGESKLDADDQPRDDHGRFAETDGSGSGSGSGSGASGNPHDRGRDLHVVRKDLEQAEADHEKAEEAEADAEADHQAAADEHEDDVSEAKEAHADAVSDARDAHAAEVESLESELQEAREDVQVHEELAAQNDFYANDLKNSRAELEKAEKAHAKGLEKAQARLDKDLAKADAKLAKAQEKADAKLAKAKQAMDEAKAKASEAEKRVRDLEHEEHAVLNREDIDADGDGLTGDEEERDDKDPVP